MGPKSAHMKAFACSLAYINTCMSLLSSTSSSSSSGGGGGSFNDAGYLLLVTLAVKLPSGYHSPLKPGWKKLVITLLSGSKALISAIFCFSPHFASGIPVNSARVAFRISVISVINAGDK